MDLKIIQDTLKQIFNSYKYLTDKNKDRCNFENEPNISFSFKAHLKTNRT